MYHSTYVAGRFDGMQEGVEIGRKEGIKDEKLKTAKSMLAEGFDIKTIGKITGLDEKDLLHAKSDHSSIH